MFLTKRAIPGRTLLKWRAALALPLLDAMIPAGTAWAQTAAKPCDARLRVHPNGLRSGPLTPPGQESS
jgi:hypothetical protein